MGLGTGGPSASSMDRPSGSGWSAFGETPEEALAKLKVAPEAWLEAARKARKPIPIAKYRPAIYEAVAGSACGGS